RAAQTEADRLKNEQKTEGEKMKQKLSPDERTALQAGLRQLKESIQAKEKQQTDAEAEANQIMLQLPAIPDPSWPVGKDAEENLVVRTWPEGKTPEPLRKDQKDH